jgi:hypothetical protein
MTKPKCAKVTDYWFAYYPAGGLGLCTLCGNTGIIDTRLTAISPAGIRAGRLNYCICPNGQHMRHAKSPLS